MKFRMGSMTVEGANPIGHLLNRQIGNNIYYFRRNLFRERLASARNLYRRNLVSHYGCVNAIEFSSSGDLLVSGGDDRRVLLWKLEEAMAGIGEPQVMKNQHYSNIFCLSFNNDSTKIFSGGNDEAVIVHDSKTCESCVVFSHTKPVYGLSVDMTNDQVFATAGEDGLVLIFDLRVGTHILALPKSRASFHAVQFHPTDGNTIITANEKDGAALWDLRDSKQPLIRYDGEKDFVQSCMSVRFNTHGTQVLALRRRLPPILYNTHCEDSICQFYHADYFNSCTMKSCSFAGDNDEYVISGSDDFNLYMWRVTDANTNKKNQWIDSHHMVLYGHRSIVNQVRYNPQKCLLASSGVEKVIKIWRPFELEDWTGSLVEDGPINTRDIFSHEEYVSLSNSSQSMTHDYSHQNTQEDPRMMAFFDSLVQREIEGWNSNDNSDSDKSSVHSSDGSSRRTSTLQSESDEVYGRESANRNRTMIKSRSRYLNRIAYLIATKRNTLKRLALKGSTRTTRRVRSIKCSTRKLHRSSFRQPRKTNGKRLNRMNSRTKSRDCNGNNSETELPKNLAKRRQQSHFNIPSYRVNRRVNKTQLHKTFYANCESGDSSSSDDENLSDSNNGASSSALSKLNGSHDTNSTNGRPNSNNDQNDSTTNFPIPSTSTGITGNGAHFRIVQTPDSDEQSDSSPVLSNMSLVPATKVNGVHSTNNTTSAAATAAAAAAAAASAATVPSSTASTAAGTAASHPAYSSSGVDDDQPSERNSRRKRRANSLTTANYHFTNYSSHSSSRLSNSSSSSCSDDDSSDGSSMPFFSNHLSKRSRKAENINEMRTATTTPTTTTAMTPTAVANSTNTPQTSSNLLRLERTPARSGDRKDYDLDTPDSGIGSTPGSSR